MRMGPVAGQFAEGGEHTTRSVQGVVFVTLGGFCPAAGPCTILYDMDLRANRASSFLFSYGNI